MINRPILISPINEIALKRRALMGEIAGWRLARQFVTPSDETRAARERVALADETPNGKLYLEGAETDGVLQKALGIGALTIHGGAKFDQGFIYRLRRDLCFIHTYPGSEHVVAEKVAVAARDLCLLPGSSPAFESVLDGRGAQGRMDAFVTITDVTHGHAELRVIGHASRALLAKLCGLDFHPDRFPNQGAKQSSLAKSVQLIVRRDIGELPAFSIIGARSYGAYIWETLMRAGDEFGIVPVGYESVQTLEEAAG